MFHSETLLIVIVAAIVGSSLLMQQSTGMFLAFASESSPYESGRDHGCDDAGRSESDKYLNQPERGPSFHTPEFMNGYYAGLNACSNGGGGDDDDDGGGGGGGDFDQPREIQPREIQPREIQPNNPPSSSQQGGMDWIKTCNDLQIALVSSCEVLVNPDNTLTSEGERAVGCIQNGIILAGGGTFLASLPLPLIIAALQILEEPTGCDGIVEWGLIGQVGGLKGIINRLT